MEITHIFGKISPINLDYEKLQKVYRDEQTTKLNHQRKYAEISTSVLQLSTICIQHLCITVKPYCYVAGKKNLQLKKYPNQHLSISGLYVIKTTFQCCNFGLSITLIKH